MIGPEIEHIAHLLAWSVQEGRTAEEVLALPFYHPTVEESLRRALRQICSERRTGQKTAGESFEFGPCP